MTDRINIAKTRVGILDVCRLIGMSEAYGGAKLWCPFGEISHPDMGSTRAFRAYPETNSVHCFACGKTWNPVTLYAEANDLTMEESADALLETIGYEPEDLDERWKRLLVTPEPEVNTAELAEALKVFCARRDPSWEVRQFDTDVATRFQRCLDLLGSVRTDADAEKWLATTKQVMATKLGETQ